MVNDTDNGMRYGERVTSTYAEIYFDDLNYESKDEKSNPKLKSLILQSKYLKNYIDVSTDDWKSPSDQIIGILALKPPFTSKITRGKTHKGILAIGYEEVENERAKFLRHLTNLINENDVAWSYILEHEKSLVSKVVSDTYAKIFLTKSKTMKKEIDQFYEQTLQEIENHITLEVQNVLKSTYAASISDLNTKINAKIHEEKKILKNILNGQYENEITKIKKYYKILITHESHQINKLINNKILERNDALKAFYRQIEAENMTSTMYVMSTERKKCRIKRFILENYQSTEITEKLLKIKQRQDLMDAFKEKEVHISDINKEWEDKIKKIIRLFLKFISFALKLLPEQTTFLLDLEKMVVLQLNEICKQETVLSNFPSSILVNEEKLINTYQFENVPPHVVSCKKRPLLVEGDLADPILPKYGSRETLTQDVDIPTIRLQRQYIYAKCHQYEEIKALLESQRCKCGDIATTKPSQEASLNESTESIELSILKTSEFSNEPLLVNDIRRFHECPARLCKDFTKRITFPYLNTYLDFNEDNFDRVQAILDNKQTTRIVSELLNAKDIMQKSVPFASTSEIFRHAETQYSSQENIHMPDAMCSCVEGQRNSKYSQYETKETASNYIDEILKKRKYSLLQTLQQNPNLLKMFTDESFDFVL